MEKIMDYFTKKGWARDWEKTRIFKGFRQRVKALEGVVNQLVDHTIALEKQYGHIEGLEERYKRFDDLDERSQRLDQIAESIGDVQEFRLKKWGEVQAEWTRRLETIEKSVFDGYRLVPKTGDDSFEKVHQELVEKARDSTYWKLINAAFWAGRKTLEVFDGDYRNIEYNNRIPIASGSEYVLWTNIKAFLSNHRGGFKEFDRIKEKHLEPSKVTYEITKTGGFPTESIEIGHNLPESLVASMYTEHDSLHDDLMSAYMIGLTTAAITTDEKDTMRSSWGPSKRVFEKILNYATEMSQGRLSNHLLGSMIKEHPNLADYVAPNYFTTSNETTKVK